jgi:signal transduction histidine kinase
MDVSRIIAGKMRIEMQPLELVPVIQAAIDTVRPAAEAKKIRLHSALDDASVVVCGDRSRLQQVFWNLLSNALKFTPRDGNVEVRIDRMDSDVRIVVSDNGEGIGPDFLPYVFDRFAQATTNRKQGSAGLGLGLAIVRRFVELHGGAVHAQSDGKVGVLHSLCNCRS